MRLKPTCKERNAVEIIAADANVDATRAKCNLTKLRSGPKPLGPRPHTFPHGRMPF